MLGKSAVGPSPNVPIQLALGGCGYLAPGVEAADYRRAMGKVVTAASAVTVLLLTLSGCTESPPPVGSVPAPSETPVFASDEEALAAAEAAYAKYLEVSDAISADGGAQSGRMEGYMTAEELKNSNDDFVFFETNGLRTQGVSTFDSTELQRYDDSEVVVYLCLDVSSVRLVDGGGVDVTPIDRPDRVPLEVFFEVGESRLLIAASTVWDEASYCAL